MHNSIILDLDWVHKSLPAFGGTLRNTWALLSTLTQHFTNRWMSSQSVLFRSLRICCGPVFWILEVSGTSTYLLHSSRTKISTALLFRWTFLRPYMEGVVASKLVVLSLHILGRVVRIFFSSPLDQVRVIQDRLMITQINIRVTRITSVDH